MTRRKLVLFDIDGTLVRDDGAARDAFSAALVTVYGYDTRLDRYDFSGRTDPGISRMVLTDGGFALSEIEAGIGGLWDAYLDGLRARISPELVRVMPGIPSLLERLQAMPEVTLGLLTGNIEPGARIKLSVHDLNRYFPFGAFGSDSPQRDELPPIAVARAAEHGVNGFTTRDAVIIGDSIWDVRCARPHGSRAIAVATGPTRIDTLRDESPDALFETLADTEAVIDAILGR